MNGWWNAVVSCSPTDPSERENMLLHKKVKLVFKTHWCLHDLVLLPVPLDENCLLDTANEIVVVRFTSIDPSNSKRWTKLNVFQSQSHSISHNLDFDVS